MSDIIDTIDALISEQLAEGETPCETELPTCPHCDRDWHGFPLTERVASMYCYGLFDEDYRVAEDGSTVLCPGSDVHGPARPAASRQVYLSDDDDLIRSLLNSWGAQSAVSLSNGVYTFVIGLDSQGNE